MKSREEKFNILLSFPFGWFVAYLTRKQNMIEESLIQTLSDDGIYKIPNFILLILCMVVVATVLDLAGVF